MNKIAKITTIDFSQFPAILTSLQEDYFTFATASMNVLENEEKIITVFEKNPSCSLVACRIRYADQGKYHRMDFRFKKQTISNVMENPLFVEAGLPGTVYRKKDYLEALDKCPVRSHKGITQYLILKSGIYGLCKDVTYTLSQHEVEPISPEYPPKHEEVSALFEICPDSLRAYLESWLFYEAALSVQSLDPVTLLPFISGKTIMTGKMFPLELRSYFLSMKNSESGKEAFTLEGNKLYYEGNVICDFSTNKQMLIYSACEFREGKIFLCGKIRNIIFDFLGDEASLIFRVNQKLFPSRKTKYQFGTMTYYKQTARRHSMFEVEIPLMDSTMEITPELHYKDHVIPLHSFQGKFSLLANDIPCSYTVQKGYIMFKSEKKLVVYKPKHLKAAILKREWKFRSYLRDTIRKPELAKIRQDAWFYRLFKKKEKIWLISDREDIANDNGEHFFKYVCQNCPQGVHPYFLLREDSTDFSRMKEYGDVVALGSKEHHNLLLSADLIISSSGNNYIFDVFGDDRSHYFQDMKSYEYVFLQHGLTKDDVSDWLNKTNKNIRLFITSAVRERDSIIDGNYGYSSREVIMPGMSRFDHLLHMSTDLKKQIVILPTWRKSIKGSYNELTSESIYFDGFKNTEFFQFYDGLINHPRLLKAMRTAGYQGRFGLHPIHSKQNVDFHGNDVFTVLDGYLDYQKEFVTNRLMITDYSSTAFDFVYLRKPVLYCQFDKESFFQGHSYSEGYFDYKRDGFGPVCETLEETVDEIIKIIENDCLLSDRYKDRVDQFFAYNDDKCCQRTLDAILQL